ncbi:MAG TPA: hypothetical protein PKZ73_05755, partial [Methanomassiliicoccales archaeon]|nr:hypothetical protein [Methanomassiliicoccales archaeon]
MTVTARFSFNGADAEIHRVATAGAGHDVAIVTGFRRILRVFCTWAENPGAAAALFYTVSGSTVTVDNNGDADKAVD